MQRVEYAPAASSLVTSASPGTITIRPDRTVMSLLSTLKNDSGGNVTAVTVARTLDGVIYGPERSVTTGIPLAAGSTLDVDLIDEPAIAYRFTITAASAGAVTLTSRGVV